MTDTLTVAWKEWKELFAEGGRRRSGWFRIAILLALVGVVLPLQSGPAWTSSPVLLAMAAWMPFILISAIIADAFAGERERHTLETLLASRLSDTAILAGKIAAAVAYGWGVMLLACAVGLAVVDIAARKPLLYPAWMVAGVLGVGLLTSLLAAGAGVLVSLRAPTVRQAQQTLSIASMLLVFVPAFGLPALPAHLRHAALARLARLDPHALVATAAAALLLLDLALIAAARARFRRGRLIAR